MVSKKNAQKTILLTVLAVSVVSLTLMVLMVLMVPRVFAEKLATLPELNRPSYIEIRNEEVYVLDDTAVKVYDLKACRLLRQFGKKGNGPGELMPNDEIPLQMQLVNGEVFLNSQTKFIHYSYTGDILKEKTTHFMCMQIIPLGENYCISRVKFTPEMEIFFHVILYDSELREIKTIYTDKPSPTVRSRGKIIVPPNFLYMKLSPSGQRLYVFNGRQEEFQVLVFDREGNPLPTIRMEYQRPKLTDAFKQEFIEFFKTTPRYRENSDLLVQRLEFPAFLPAIRNIQTEGNLLYVQTYKKKATDSEFFIFDENAQLMGQVFLPDDGCSIAKLNPDVSFTIMSDRYYYLVENLDKHEWELHTMSIPKIGK